SAPASSAASRVSSVFSPQILTSTVMAGRAYPSRTARSSRPGAPARGARSRRATAGGRGMSLIVPLAIGSRQRTRIFHLLTPERLSLLFEPPDLVALVARLAAVAALADPV